MITDGHMHLHRNEKALLEIIKEKDIHVMMNIAHLKEYEECVPFMNIQQIHPTIGLHPWHANLTLLEDMMPLLKEATIIGEIGMDNVWCDIDLKLQRDVFERQLILAHQFHKPVVLHTKGQEKEILELIKKYPNEYLVHWYSCMEYIAEYQALDSYFTIGPDLQDPALKQIVEQVDIEHLMVETDGLSAVEWAINKKVSIDEYPNILHAGISFIAKIKKMKDEDVQKQVNDNFFHFLEMSVSIYDKSTL